MLRAILQPLETYLANWIVEKHTFFRELFTPNFKSSMLLYNLLLILNFKDLDKDFFFLLKRQFLLIKSGADKHCGHL